MARATTAAWRWATSRLSTPPGRTTLPRVASAAVGSSTTSSTPWHSTTSALSGPTTSSRDDRSPCRPVTVYGAAKLAGELYTEAYRQTYGLVTIIVRPFNAYGPRAPVHGTRAEVIPRFLIRALNGLPPVIFGDGSNGRDFTYVTEVARGLLAAGAAQTPVGTIVNIAYGRMVTIAQVADTVLRAVGRNDLSVALHTPRPGDVHRLHADNRRAAQLLGYQPTIEFEDGVRRYVAWFAAQYPDPAMLLEDRLENWTMPAAPVEAAP